MLNVLEFSSTTTTTIPHHNCHQMSHSPSPMPQYCYPQCHLQQQPGSFLPHCHCCNRRAFHRRCHRCHCVAVAPSIAISVVPAIAAVAVTVTIADVPVRSPTCLPSPSSSRRPLGPMPFLSPLRLPLALPLSPLCPRHAFHCRCRHANHRCRHHRCRHYAFHCRCHRRGCCCRIAVVPSMVIAVTPTIAAIAIAITIAPSINVDVVAVVLQPRLPSPSPLRQPSLSLLSLSLLHL